MSQLSGHTDTHDMQGSIDACTSCHKTCTHTVHHCLDKGGTHAAATHITLMLDCAQICATSADFLSRHSVHHQATCRVCAEVCDACAKGCDAFGDDEMMRQCAAECRRCAASCRAMAAMT